MKTKLLLFILCLASLSVMGQGTIAREKCKTCGKAIVQCQHKGKHPKCADCGKILENCQYNGKHPKCADCGRTLDKCNYKGKHPKCKDCGKSIDKCKYDGKHPKCGTCGKTLDNCKYKGKHPQPEKKCKSCGKELSKCKYKGKHPQPAEQKCSTCGKATSKCEYNGNHPAPEAAGYDVTFSCNVPSATLYVDGEAYGNATGTRFLKTGEHTIKVVEAGYNDYSESIIVNHQNTSYTIDLTLDINLIAKPTPAPIVTSGTINGHEWVDLGLSVKWATCNVGANTPSDYGDYYAWGETSTKSRYDWDNCYDCINPKHEEKDSSWGCYRLNGLTRITPTSNHDTARENWGGTWRLPTDEEMIELREKCKWTWTAVNGRHKGYTITGPNGNSIFLPASGYFWRYFDEVGNNGYYWTSTLSLLRSCYARMLGFTDKVIRMYNSSRKDGQSIRPVTE